MEYFKSFSLNHLLHCPTEQNLREVVEPHPAVKKMILSRVFAPEFLLKSRVQFPSCLSPLHWRWNVMTDIITFLHSSQSSRTLSPALSPLQQTSQTRN